MAWAFSAGTEWRPVERNAGRGEREAQRRIEIMHSNIVGRNAAGNLRRPFVSMESEHRPPDAPSKPPSLEARRQADEGPKSARRDRVLDDHERDAAAPH